MTRLLPLLFVVLLVLVVVMAARRGRAATPALQSPLVERVKGLAWDHRDLDPELAGALIARIREADRGLRRTGEREVLDDLLEIAWQHRETSPELSVIVIETIRRPGPPELR